MLRTGCVIISLALLITAGDTAAARNRSAKARADFMRQHPCPSTGSTRGSCPGFIVDHIVPLKRGGRDHPDNMQWQTIDAARRKDRTE